VRAIRAEQFHENTTVEILWTVIPFLILVRMAYPLDQERLLAMRDTSNPDMTIKATGFQWKWRYDYLEDDVSFYQQPPPRRAIRSRASQPKASTICWKSTTPLSSLVGKRFRVLTTANDVIHAWWVSLRFGVNRMRFPDSCRDILVPRRTSRGPTADSARSCAARSMASLPIVVEVVSRGQLQEWVAQQKAKKAQSGAAACGRCEQDLHMDELKAQGEKVYAKTCVACHQPNARECLRLSRRWCGGKISTGPLAATLDIVVNGSKKNPANGWHGRTQLSDTRDRIRDHLRAQLVRQQGRRHGAADRKSRALRK
jgi:cytochrome c oxidase subunit 2